MYCTEAPHWSNENRCLPADKCRKDDVIITPKRRFDVLMTLLLRHVSVGLWDISYVYLYHPLPAAVPTYHRFRRPHALP